MLISNLYSASGSGRPTQIIFSLFKRSEEPITTIVDYDVSQHECC